MWLRITPDMDIIMEVALQGVSDQARDRDVQLYEDVVREALRERMKKVFAEEDIRIYAVDVGIAREKYLGTKAA